MFVSVVVGCCCLVVVVVVVWLRLICLCGRLCHKLFVPYFSLSFFWRLNCVLFVFSGFFLCELCGPCHLFAKRSTYHFIYRGLKSPKIRSVFFFSRSKSNKNRLGSKRFFSLHFYESLLYEIYIIELPFFMKGSEIKVIIKNVLLAQNWERFKVLNPNLS